MAFEEITPLSCFFKMEMNQKDKVTGIESAQPLDKEKSDSPISLKCRIFNGIRICIVLLVFAGFLFHFSIQIQKYLKYPKITIESSNKIGNIFPDFTICSSSFFHAMRNIQPVPGKRIIEDIFQKNLASIWNTVLFNTSDLQRIPDTQKYDYVEAAYHSIMPYMAISEAGPVVGDFVLDCRYDSRSCDFRDMVTFWHPKHGACFTFKPADRFLDAIGPNAGLILMLLGKANHITIDFQQSMTTLVKGMKVTLHPSDSWPDIEKPQFTVDTSKNLQIDYTYSPLKRLNIPEGSCLEHSNQQQLCRIESGKGLVCRSFNATDTSMRLVEQQKSLYRHCRCISYEWPIPVDLRNAISCYFVPSSAYLHAGFASSSGGLIVQYPNNTNMSMSSLSRLHDLRSRFTCYNQLISISSKDSVRSSSFCQQKFYKLTARGTKLWESLGSLYRNVKLGIGLQLFYGWTEVIRGLRLANMTTFWETPKAFLKPYFDMVLKPNGKFDSSVALQMERSYAEPLASFKEESVSIYVSSTTLATYLSEEVPTYDGLFFLADAGGILGLWIGFSLYTISELIEWILSLQARKTQ